MPPAFKASVVDKLLGFTCGESLAPQSAAAAAARAPEPPPPPPLTCPQGPPGLDGTAPPGLAPPPAAAAAPAPPAGQRGGGGGHGRAGVCGASFGSSRALAAHLREAHEVQFCRTCLEHRPVFCSEQARFGLRGKGPAELERHATVGDAATGFKGHPKCSWCKDRFYDEKALVLHYSKTHFCCHLCDRAGVANKV